ncbi:MAG: hypothetical protein H6R26_1621 [Proteobacteria bacterium]|nr:hypothetical protein [Pseudomonadota bacterium]
MSKPICFFFSAMLCAFGASTAHAGGPSGALHSSGPQPVILSSHVDRQQHRLLVTGAHFGRRPVAVDLGGHALTVLKASDTEIVAGLPADLPASIYRLRIGPTDNLLQAATFSLPVQLAEGEIR